MSLCIRLQSFTFLFSIRFLTPPFPGSPILMLDRSGPEAERYNVYRVGFSSWVRTNAILKRYVQSVVTGITYIILKWREIYFVDKGITLIFVIHKRWQKMIILQVVLWCSSWLLPRGWGIGWRIHLQHTVPGAWPWLDGPAYWGG